VVVDSITELAAPQADRVVVCGSHAGLYVAHFAAHRRVAAIVLHDAGVGRDAAGVGGLGYLDEIGIPAAAVDSHTARIGDGADVLHRGRLNAVNRHGLEGGWEAGMPVSDALALADAWPSTTRPELPPPTEGRQLLVAGPVPVWALDSVSLVEPADANAVIATGSHGGLLGGRAEKALRYPVLGALFNDAGGGIDDAGLGRLPVLDEQGIPAATVSADSAWIGDGRSTYSDGILSAANQAAGALGATPGISASAFAELITANTLAEEEGAADDG
jgi:hypothetical protein